MAIIKETDGDVQLFTPSDVYRYDVDNRPLRNLISNDQALNTELEATTAEVVQARTGLTFTYPTLDARLDDLELGAGLPQKVALFNEFMAAAEARNAQYASGVLTPLTEVFSISDIATNGPFTVNTNANYGAAPFGQLLLRNDDPTQANRVSLCNGFWLNFNSGTSEYAFGTYAPVPMFVNGLLVRLFNEGGGVANTGKANEITWNLPAAPASGVRTDLLWIEVYIRQVARAGISFFPHGATGSLASAITTADNDAVRSNTGFYSGNGGDYFQVSHRLRVTAGVNPETHQFGMSDPLVLARANAGAPVATYTYTNAGRTKLSDKRDPGLWVAGSGDAQSKTDLGTIDGYSYAIPVALVFRRNTGQWLHSNQNGTRTSGGDGSWATGDSARPDGYFHDKIEKDDIVLIAPSTVSGKTDFKRIMDESFDRLLRGRLRTRHGYLRYDSQYVEDNYDTLAEPVAGPVVTSVNSIAGSAITKTDQFTDFVANRFGGTPPPGMLSGDSRLSYPDDFRRAFAAQTEDQMVGFSINLVGPTPTPANFVAIAGNLITLKAIGQSAGVGNADAVVAEAPVMWWSGSNKAVAVVGGAWANVGSGTITASLNTGDVAYNAAGTIVGFVKIKFGSTRGGYKKPNFATVGQTYVTPALAEIPFTGITSISGEKLLNPAGTCVTATHLYIADMAAHKVWKLDVTTNALVASFGVYKTSGADNTHLNQPTHITVDASNNVFINDTLNHRVVKLDSSMAYVGQFGATNSAGSDNTHLSSPRGIAVDPAGNLYIADTGNFRVVKANSSLLWTAQFGVTGVTVNDETHCINPRGCFFAADNRVYVADGVRIIILDPATMTPVGFLQPGINLPISRTNSVQALTPSQVLLIREDSAGNKYVLHKIDSIPPYNVPGHVITKYSSSWTYLARYGAAFDLYNLYGGQNAGQNFGLTYTRTFVLDEANNAIIIYEPNTIAGWDTAPSPTPVLTNGPYGQYPNQSRMIIIAMSTLAGRSGYMDLNVDIFWGNYTGGAITPYGPSVGPRPNTIQSLPQGAQWPGWGFGGIGFELDTVNRYAYIVTGSSANPDFTRNNWARIEKWAAPTHDIRTWTFVTSWGKQDLVSSGGGYSWVAWASPADDAVAFYAPARANYGVSLLADGNRLFVGDNNTVIKFNTSGAGLVYEGRFGFSGRPGSDAYHLSGLDAGGGFIFNPLRVAGSNISDTNARVYVADFVNQRLVILRANSVWDSSGSASARVTEFRNPHFSIYQAFQTIGRSYNQNKLFLRTENDPQIPGPYELDISSRDAPTFIFPGSVSNATIFVPSQSTAPLPVGVGNEIVAVAGADGKLFWVDYGTNQIVCINLADFRFIGECGTPGIGQSDRANWNGPWDISADASKLYVADLRNSRVFSAQHHLAHVQQNIGRVEFLMPPEIGSKWFGYSKYQAYQGVVNKCKPNIPYAISNEAAYPPLSGRAVLMQPEKLLVTTLGRGSVETLKSPGIVSYANCIAHFPIPQGQPDESQIVPSDFVLAGKIIGQKPHFFMPVLNIESDYKGQFAGENDSFWNKETMLMATAQLNVAAGSRGGRQSIFSEVNVIVKPTSLLFPIVSSFGCENPPNYRYAICPFLVVVEGEVLLAVRIEGIGAGTSGNEVGGSQTDLVELYRPIGHPMLKNNGESDYNFTTS